MLIQFEATRLQLNKEPKAHPSFFTAGSLFFSSSLSSSRRAAKPLSWVALYSGLNNSSSRRLTKQPVWYQRSIRPSWGFSGSTVFFDTRMWSWTPAGKNRLTYANFLCSKSSICLTKGNTFSIFWSHPLQVLLLDLAYSTAKSFSDFSPLAAPFCPPLPVKQWGLRNHLKTLWLKPNCFEAHMAKSVLRSKGIFTSSSTSALNGFLHFLLVIPAEVSKSRDVRGRLYRSTEPKAGKMVPVRHFAIKHGRLWKTDRCRMIKQWIHNYRYSILCNN